MKKMDELMTTLKLDELLNKRDNEKKKNTLLWVLAIVGAVAAIAGIAYAVYRFVWMTLTTISSMTMISWMMRKRIPTRRTTKRRNKTAA